MERRIESKTSRTAEFTCLIRAQSFMEQRKLFKGDDDVSLVIANSLVKLLLAVGPIRNRFLQHYPAGMYEYVIARTRCIDAELTRAMDEGFQQVLIFGAGFDSRGIRFRDITKNAKVFEFDVPVTQNAKIARYREKGIELPENLVFIPIDFETQSISERLLESGFVKSAKSLFILEGLTMYLQPEAVDRTFRTLQDFAGPGSRVLFDHVYASVIRQENLYDGERELYQSVLRRKERFCFGIEKGRVKEFLSAYGFEVLRVMDSRALEEAWFKEADGSVGARVNGTHCIVAATKVAPQP
jgi:methyltransferase (TIGR00027 family)